MANELYVGRRGVLGIAAEAVRGTAAAAPTFFIPYNSLELDSKSVKKEIGGAFGSIQDTRNALVVKKFAEGSFEADMDDKAIGLILAGIFGALPTTTGSTNLTHAYAIEESNQHQSMTLTIQDPNISANFALAMIDKLEISVEPEGICSYKAEFRSKSGADDSAVIPDYSALGNVFLHSDVSVKIAANEAGLGAASAINITELTLSIEKNVEDFNDLGSLTLSEIINKQMKVSASMKLGYIDQTYRDLLLADTNKAVQITFSKGANNNLVIILPTTSITDWSPDKGLDDIVTQEVEFKAHWASSADAIKATLKNQTDYAIDES